MDVEQLVDTLVRWMVMNETDRSEELEWQGKRVTVLGLAREGTAVAQFLVERGAAVTVTDLKSAEALQSAVDSLQGLPVRYYLGGHPPEVLDCDVLFVSPGVPLDAPIMMAARGRGLSISSESRLFCRLSPAPVVGITGSSGKTTTATLVARMLEESGRRAHLGGNIGDPLIGRLSDIRPEDVCVVELSSFQLNYFGSELDANPGGDLAAPLFPAGGWSPPTAAVLNVTPNHLDRHPSMSDYAAAKLRILQHQGEYDLAVLNWDDPVTRAFAAHCPGKTAFFSLSEEVACGAYLRRGQLTLRRAEKEVVVCLVGDVRLRGMHNVANVLAACAVTHSLGVTPAQMAKVARTFEGVEHRLEVVRQLQGVWYVNDSIATSPERAIAALRSFDEPIVLLAGGRDKHLPWGEWAELAGRKATHIVVFGEAAALIEGQLSKLGKGAPPVLQADDLAQAVELARTVARPGDVVLFSPGGTSFDAFDDYAERGRVFRNLVAELPGGARGTVAHEQRGQR